MRPRGPCGAQRLPMMSIFARGPGRVRYVPLPCAIAIAMVIVVVKAVNLSICHLLYVPRTQCLPSFGCRRVIASCRSPVTDSKRAEDIDRDRRQVELLAARVPSRLAATSKFSAVVSPPPPNKRSGVAHNILT